MTSAWWIGAGLAAAELALRVARRLRGGAPLHHAWRTPDARLLAFDSHPYALYVKRPNSRGLYPSTSLGYAGTREVRVARAPNSVRIFCAGGSTTELHDPAKGPDSSWPGQLQDLLAARFPLTTIECINAGTAGYTSAESLAEFLFRGIDLRPDILLVYHNVNDAWTAQMVEGFKPDYSHARRHKPWRLGWINRIPQLPWWAAYQVARDWLTRRFGKINALIYWIANPPWKSVDAFNPDAVRAFERNIGHLAVAAEASSCVPVLIHWECDWQTRRLPNYLERKARTTDIYFQFLRANNDALGRVAKRVATCRCLEVGPFEPRHFADTVHFSADGLTEMARRVAAAIEPVVREIVERQAPVLAMREER